MFTRPERAEMCSRAHSQAGSQPLCAGGSGTGQGPLQAPAEQEGPGLRAPALPGRGPGLCPGSVPLCSGVPGVTDMSKELPAPALRDTAGVRSSSHSPQGDWLARLPPSLLSHFQACLDSTHPASSTPPVTHQHLWGTYCAPQEQAGPTLRPAEEKPPGVQDTAVGD